VRCSSHLRLINASAYRFIGRYPRLKHKIIDIFIRDTSSVIRLFPVANGTLFAENIRVLYDGWVSLGFGIGLRYRIRIKVSVRVRISCRSGVSVITLTMSLISYALNADNGRYADALIRYRPGYLWQVVRKPPQSRGTGCSRQQSVGQQDNKIQSAVSRVFCLVAVRQQASGTNRPFNRRSLQLPRTLV